MNDKIGFLSIIWSKGQKGSKSVFFDKSIQISQITYVEQIRFDLIIVFPRPIFSKQKHVCNTTKKQTYLSIPHPETLQEFYK